MKKLFLATLATLTFASAGRAQQLPFDRLPLEEFAVVPPTERVEGTPGEMTVQRASCQVLPTGETRQRIVDVAVQEWGFFGFSIVDETYVEVRTPRADSLPPVIATVRRRGRRADPEESARVASSIAGYWAVTPDGSWMIERQNARWNGQSGVAARWRDPWSAAFVSWVMCEGGLGDTNQFRRAIAHHTYIDQAIRARDRGPAGEAFVAYDLGEAAIEPGDILCRGSRPAYRSLAERRRQMGVGARSHCDVVVKVDEPAGRILAIGGNVRGTVSLKLLPAVRDDGEELRPAARRGRNVFAHLKLQADPIGSNALDESPTIQALPCALVLETPVRAAARTLAAAGAIAARC